MDTDKLIEAITEKVLAKLTPSPETPPLPSQAAPPAGASSAGESPALSPEELAAFIDHTLLKPDAPDQQFDQLCDEAREYGFKSVCVNSSRVAYVARRLRGSGVLVCSVVGFPLGAMSSRAKAFETREAVSQGAAEIDMVIPIGKLKSKDYPGLEEDIRAVRRSTRSKTVLKVIIETSMLTEEEKIFACQISQSAGADFVKTSTGFGGGGALVEDIKLMRKVVGDRMGVKASGGIRDYQTAVSMIAAGATRIGAGAGVAIVTGAQGQGDY